jgi:hypothetical protein
MWSLVGFIWGWCRIAITGCPSGPGTEPTSSNPRRDRRRLRDLSAPPGSVARVDDLERYDAGRLGLGDVLVLGADAILDVHIPVDSWSAGRHVDVGDFGGTPRHRWPDGAGAAEPLVPPVMVQRWRDPAMATGLAVET